MIPHPFGFFSLGTTMRMYLAKPSHRYPEIEPVLFSEAIFPNFFSKILDFQPHQKMINEKKLLYFLSTYFFMGSSWHWYLRDIKGRFSHSGGGLLEVWPNFGLFSRGCRVRKRHMGLEQGHIWHGFRAFWGTCWCNNAEYGPFCCSAFENVLI